jgi:membrane protein YdbS with pleckstrin-like domain
MNSSFCNQCGQPLVSGSRFCNRCGAQVISDSNFPSRPAAGAQGEAYGGGQEAARGAAIKPLHDAPPMAGEREIFTLRPTMIFVYMWYALAAIVVLAVAAGVGLLSREPGWFQDQSFLVIALAGLLVFSVPIYKHIMRRRSVFTLTNHNLEMRYGIIAKTVRNIPVGHIQDVTVTSAVWQRLLNLGDIEILSASETGKIVLDDIHNPSRYAKIILGEMRNHRN